MNLDRPILYQVGLIPIATYSAHNPATELPTNLFTVRFFQLVIHQKNKFEKYRGMDDYGTNPSSFYKDSKP